MNELKPDKISPGITSSDVTRLPSTDINELFRDIRRTLRRMKWMALIALISVIILNVQAYLLN